MDSRLLIGREIGGRFVVEKLLGEGGMGAVYVAQQTGLNRKVALKVIKDGALAGTTAVNRFQQESLSLSSLHHPQIVTVYDAGCEEDGLVWIAMELLEGESLHERLRRLKRLPTDDARTVIVGIAGALIAAHNAGIVHRDLKPANVMITSVGDGSEVPVLLDFGVAKSLAKDATNTETGILVGTPGYIAPEVSMKGKTEETLSDLYSLGVLWFELLTGRNPFTAETPVSLILKHATECAPDVREVVDSVPEQDALWIAKLLQKEPDARGKLEDLVGAISDSSGRIRMATPPPDTPTETNTALLPSQAPSSSPSWRAGARGAAALVGVASLLFAVGVWWAWSQRTPALASLVDLAGDLSDEGRAQVQNLEARIFRADVDLINAFTLGGLSDDVAAHPAVLVLRTLCVLCGSRLVSSDLIERAAARGAQVPPEGRRWLSLLHALNNHDGAPDEELKRRMRSFHTDHPKFVLGRLAILRHGTAALGTAEKVAELNRLLDVSPATPAIHVEKTWALMSARLQRESHASAKKGLQFAPDNYVIQWQHAESQFGSEEGNRNAAAWGRRALNVNPADALARGVLLEALLYLDAHEERRRVVDEVLVRRPSVIEARVLSGHVSLLTARGMVDEALRLSRTMLASDVASGDPEIEGAYVQRLLAIGQGFEMPDILREGLARGRRTMQRPHQAGVRDALLYILLGAELDLAIVENDEIARARIMRDLELRAVPHASALRRYAVARTSTDAATLRTVIKDLVREPEQYERVTARDAGERIPVAFYVDRVVAARAAERSGDVENARQLLSAVVGYSSTCRAELWTGNQPCRISVAKAMVRLATLEKERDPTRARGLLSDLRKWWPHADGNLLIMRRARSLEDELNSPEP